MNDCVAGVIVTHEASTDIEACIRSLAPQVDELVVVANLPIELPALPEHVRIIWNDEPRGFAANANAGIDATDAGWIVVANPDTLVDAGAVSELVGFALTNPRIGVVGPAMRDFDGSWQSSRRRFPTVRGTLVRRTPLRSLLRPKTRQRSHYLTGERPDAPVRADWLLGAFLLLRRRMLEELGGFDPGFRLYGEDIDLCYRAMRSGWERWLVPEAGVVHRHAAATDPLVPHMSHALALAERACARSQTSGMLRRL